MNAKIVLFDEDAHAKIVREVASKTSEVARALEEPLRQIVVNAGAEASVVLDRVVAGSGAFGYNAANGACATAGASAAAGVLLPVHRLEDRHAH